MTRGGPAAREAAGHRGMRRRNLSLVLGQVSRRTEVSRANIADATGLTKATISALVDELMEFGLLVERGIQESGKVGRPGRVLSLNGDTVAGIGIEINVDYVAVCVLDLLGVTRQRRVVRQDNRQSTPDSVLDTVARLGGRALKWVADRGLIAAGVTVAVPGAVDVKTGMLLNAPNLGWTQLPLADMVASRLRRPDLKCHVENEANLGALGELWEGRGREWGDFIHISGEIGVGAGMVFGGALWSGFEGLGGELGHLQVDRDGPLCPCGSRGCLERYVGQEALLAAAGLDSLVGTAIGTSSGGTAGELLARAEAGDSRTVDALTAAGQILGGACLSVAYLLNPATIVLGGIYAALAPWMIPPIEAVLAQRKYLPAPRVVVSELGTDAAVRGAASWTLHEIMADPLLMEAQRIYSANPAPTEQETG